MKPSTPRVYLTLSCNLHCTYCSNGHDIRWTEADEMGVEEWLHRIGELPGDEVALTGGEPTGYRGFRQLVGCCPKYMYIYSNFAQALPEFPSDLRIHWRASCHARTVEEAGDWIENVTAMRERGYTMDLTTVYAPTDVFAILKEHGILVDEPQYRPVPMQGRVSCRLPRILIAPDGERYHCVSRLVRHDETGIVALDGPDTVVCEDATRCVPCDSLASERTPCPN